MRHLIDLFKSARPRYLLFFSGYAFYLVFSYMVKHSSTMIASVGDFAPGTHTLFLLCASGVCVTVFLAVVILVRAFIRAPVSLLAAVAVGFALMSFIIAQMSSQFSHLIASNEYIPWMLLSGGLLGVGDALTLLLWARFSATLRLRTVYLFVLFCYAIGLVFYFLVTWPLIKTVDYLERRLDVS